MKSSQQMTLKWLSGARMKIGHLVDHVIIIFLAYAVYVAVLLPMVQKKLTRIPIVMVSEVGIAQHWIPLAVLAGGSCGV